MPPRLRSPAGQASVELVALLPLLAIVAAAAWQLCLAGHASWSAGAAAKAAARAHAVGGDPESAARAALTPALEAGLRVRADGDWIRVSVRIPRLPPFPAERAEATARFGEHGARATGLAAGRADGDAAAAATGGEQA